MGFVFYLRKIAAFHIIFSAFSEVERWKMEIFLAQIEYPSLSSSASISIDWLLSCNFLIFLISSYSRTKGSHYRLSLWVCEAFVKQTKDTAITVIAFHFLSSYSDDKHTKMQVKSQVSFLRFIEFKKSFDARESQVSTRNWNVFFLFTTKRSEHDISCLILIFNKSSVELISVLQIDRYT